MRAVERSDSAPKALGGGIEGYYKIHATVYDLTRWSFLFGRGKIVNAVDPEPKRILEVGCGTGGNLIKLRKRFPNAEITGLDLSGEMLSIARRKIDRAGVGIDLVRRSYDRPVGGERGFDLILFSYALSMFNPGFEAAIDAARVDLSLDGQIAVVDFCDSRFDWFRRWMRFNHVRMEGELLPYLNRRFDPSIEERVWAAGTWRYFIYVGRKIGDN